MKNSISCFFRWAGCSDSLSKFNTLVVAFLLSFSSGLSADDTELFFSAESAPANLLFILDTSISMATRECSLDPLAGNYDPNCEDDRTRMEKLQAALALVIENLDGVNAGIIKYNSTNELVVPVGNVDDAKKQELLAAVNALVPKAGTGTQAALWTGREYMRGQLAGPTGIYPSPITHECQKNHVILMSDGKPTDHLNNFAEVQSDLGITCETVGVINGGECGAEIGQHLFDADHSNFAGSNIITHTIGFNFIDSWLASISGNTDELNGVFSGGFGRHFDVKSAPQLLSAFESIIEGVGTSFAAPTIALNSFNESRHRDEIYYSQFQSSETVRWNGNIKKYRLSELTDDVTGETETVIVDANDLPIADDTGQIDPGSQSLWSAQADGGSIPQGGFANKLPHYTDRHWYTDYNSTDPFKLTSDDLDVLPPQSLGAADETERDTLAMWALGRDAGMFDPLVAAAATAASDTAASAANNALVVAAEAVTASAAADAAAADANAIADAASQAATEAAAAVDAALASGAANLADLIAASEAASTEAVAAAATAATLSDAATVAADAAAIAQTDATVATAEASLAFAAAEEANQENHFFIADSLHNSPVLASYWARSDTDERGEILFSANNLGVLHAIDPATGSGVELWSYTPEEHLGNIKAYFENAASPEHVYGLDGDFLLHTTRTNQPGYDLWVDRAWLYMTERRGGNRVYALDVSDGLADPSTSDPFSVMWKITGGDISAPVYDKDSDGRNDFADLAQTWSKPIMVSVSLNCPENCETKELLMFSGGYNPDVYDDVDLDYSNLTVPSESHGNAVYFVDPETGELAWSVGNGAHHSLNLAEMNHSIPSTPVPVDADLDGTIDLMFFVDVGGDVWRVDFSSEATDLDELHLAGGKIAELSPAGQSLRFFNPIDVVVSGTSFSTSFFSLVTGSGMRARPLYQEPNRNRLYSIVDPWVRRAPFRVNANGDREFDYRYVTDSGGNHSVITASDDVLKNISDANSTTSTEYGFFRTFEHGEKFLQRSLVHSSQIFVNSYVPPAQAGGDNCNFDIGETRLYAFDLLDGGNSFEGIFNDDFIVVGEGLLSGGQIIDTGEGDAPFFLVDKNVFTLKEIVASDKEVFRRFHRTGWVELEDF